MVEAIGLQQVLSLSSMAEKVQHNTQHRTDVVHQDTEAAKKKKEMEESRALPPSDKSEQAAIYDEDTGRRGMQSKARLKKKAKKKEEDEKLEQGKTADGLNQGSLVDLVV